MQFHLNGFRPGDPDVHDPVDAAGAPDTPPDAVDVLIVGCGPAGLTLAAQMAAFPDIRTRIIEQKDGPLQRGQADGIACRTMEMFQAFGFVDKVLRESYWVNETTFWRPDEADRGRIVRGGRMQDTEDGLSEFPHVILNQARVHDFYLEKMRNAPTRLVPDYGRRFAGLTVDPDADYPVTVTADRLDPGHEGQTQTIRARYVVGCDGARSGVRKAIGRELRGDSANKAWGVMDVLAVTDFPDIRLKGLIQSADEGSIVLIPREGGYLFRIYVEMDALARDERVASRNITADHLIAATQRVLRPYSFEVKEVAWWSVYEIGQRLCDRYDDAPGDGTRTPRVFIAGDACHTHSPKAGQGMNVSMRDAFNLGWKLAAVLRGQCAPEVLHSYSEERQKVARMLIDFDREWSKMLGSPPRSKADPDGVDPEEFRAYFARQQRYTAGTTIEYGPGVFRAEGRWQALAPGYPLGRRFHSAPVVRLADAKPMQLGHVVQADGRWRVIAFAGPDGAGIAALCGHLGGADSFLRRVTPNGADVDAVVDFRAVFRQGVHDVKVEDLPPELLPRKGRFGLIDYEKAFCADPAADIFAMRGIDPDGCIVVVRPDQHVAHVLPLDGHADLAGFFEGFLRPAG